MPVLLLQAADSFSFFYFSTLCKKMVDCLQRSQQSPSIPFSFAASHHLCPALMNVSVRATVKVFYKVEHCLLQRYEQIHFWLAMFSMCLEASSGWISPYRRGVLLLTVTCWWSLLPEAAELLLDSWRGGLLNHTPWRFPTKTVLCYTFELCYVMHGLMNSELVATRTTIYVEESNRTTMKERGVLSHPEGTLVRATTYSLNIFTLF